MATEGPQLAVLDQLQLIEPVQDKLQVTAADDEVAVLLHGRIVTPAGKSQTYNYIIYLIFVLQLYYNFT